MNALLSYTLPTSGRYVLGVSAHEPSGSTPTAPYTLTASSHPLSLPLCSAAADSSEPDDTLSQARTITVDGTPSSGNRHISNDRDWFAFSARPGVTYSLEVSSKSTVQASLFAAEPITPLATISATPTVAEPGVVTWTASAEGIHWVEVSGQEDAGCTTIYTLRITAEDSVSPNLDLQIPGNGYTNTLSVDMTIVTSDTGSGVDAWRSAGTAAFSGIGWTAVPTQATWLLPAGDGIKTIYAQARDRRRTHSQVATATITLDTVAPEITLAHDDSILSLPTVNLPLVLTTDTAAVRWHIAASVWNDWIVPDAPYTISLPEQFGLYSVEIQARDQASNFSSIRNIAVTVVPPVLFLPLVSDD